MRTSRNNGCFGCIVSFMIVVSMISIVIASKFKTPYIIVPIIVLLSIIKIKSIVESSTIRRIEQEEAKAKTLQQRQKIEERNQRIRCKRIIEENARIRNAELNEQDKRDNREQYEQLTKR